MKKVEPRLLRGRITFTFLFVGLALTGAAVQWIAVAPRERIAIDIHENVILSSLSSPQLANLVSLGFTDLGTDVGPDFLLNSSVQNTLHMWVTDAHSYGLRTFAMIGDDATALRSAEASFKIGFDYIELDDFISEGKMSLETIHNMTRYLASRYSTQVLLTEYRPQALAAAATLAREVVGLIVASDNYVDKVSLFQTYQLGRSNGVPVAAWLIFYPDSLSNPNACYNDLHGWIQEALQLGLNVYFFVVDSGGFWKVKWPTIQSLLEVRQASARTLKVAAVVSWIILCMALLMILRKISECRFEARTESKS